MEALRKLTVEQSKGFLDLPDISDRQLSVREYHKTYYVPHNLSLIVAGKLSSGTETLLSVIQNKVEPSIIAHGQDKGPKPPGWDRPFVETASARRKPITELIQHTVEFPERDESTGELIINYLGTRTEDFLESTVRVLSFHDFELGLIKVQALEILGSYLTSSPTAPLNKEFVEIESPLWYVWPGSSNG